MIAVDLFGKTALVTGGGQGLGATTAARLAEAGANVAINYFADSEGTNRARAEETAQRIGERAVTIVADVRVFAQVEAMIQETVSRFGRLDIVVNNAGILRDRTVKKLPPEDWQAVVDTNLTGVYNVCKAAAECLSDGGRIINLASISAFVGFFGQSNYAAAKAGVVLTEMGKSIPEEMRAEMLKSIPLGRFGEPDEIANVILFLASELASYVTGQVIHVNGGWWG